jgi:hypothetical protein
MKPHTNYNPSGVKARPWNELEEFFSDWEPYRGNMAELIKHIRASGLDTRLFAFSSLSTLVISIYEDIQWHKETLHISFDTKTQLWHFVYYARPFQDAEFERYYELEKGIEKFEKFIEMIRW